MAVEDEPVTDFTQKEAHQYGTKSKDVPWYEPEVVSISDSARELLEKWSGVPPEKVVEHVYNLRESAWDVYPYPCIGSFRFLDLSISLHPLYPSVLERLKAGQTLLDLGCCFAQDVRKLVFDGAPTENIWGADLRLDFIELGYELFLDKDKLNVKFMAADVMDDASRLKELDGKVDIVYAGSFLHLFDWEDAIKVCKRIMRLLKPEKGSLVLGRQAAVAEAEEFPKGTKHDLGTFTRMWQLASQGTGVSLKVDGELKGHPPARSSGSGGRYTWHTEKSRQMTFTVLRE